MQDKRPVLSSKQPRKVTSFARAVTLSIEAKIKSRVVHPSVSVSPPHASSPLRQRRIQLCNYLLTCMCASSMCVHILISRQTCDLPLPCTDAFETAITVSYLHLTHTIASHRLPFCTPDMCHFAQLGKQSVSSRLAVSKIASLTN